MTVQDNSHHIGFTNKMILLFIGKSSHHCSNTHFWESNSSSIWVMNTSLFTHKML